MGNRMYRGAVIGLGVMGQIADGLGGKHPMWYPPCCHVDAYDMHAQTELVAGATRDSGRQTRFREARNKPVYADYRDMLTQEQPDIVSIATPATVHAEMVIAAAEAGVKAIWCEKAMAVSLHECDQMIEACEKSGVVLAINHQRRWDDRYLVMKRFIDAGEVGQGKAVQIHFGGGRLCRGGSHAFDLARFFLREDIAWGMGWLSDPEVFDPGGTGVFETQSGIRIVIDGAVGMQHGFWVEVIGDGGILKLVDDGFDIQVWTPDERESWENFGVMSRRHFAQNYSVGSPFLNALDDLIQGIEEDSCVQSSGQDGRAAFEMITAIHLSHRDGKQPVEFPISERDYAISSN